MPLQDTLDALRRKFETELLPPEITEKMHRATAELAASGQAARVRKAGDRAPDFALPDAQGRTVNSAELLRDGPLVLTFYRGVWCPYCNEDLKAIEAWASEIRDRGASLAAVSPQTPANSRKSERDNGLSFPILSDHGGALAEAFGLRFALPDYLREVYLGFGNDLAKINAESSWTLPMPARYVIGQDGVIAYSEVNPDYTRRPDPSELIPVLDRLRVGQPA